jgi:uncharacterized protein (TIGR04255 family)
MDFTSYKAAPITEAIVEIQFTPALDDAERKRISDALDSMYPLVTDQITFDVGVVMKAVASVTKVDVQKLRSKSFRRTNLDQDELCIVGPKSIIVSQLAPYPGGDRFFDRVRKTFDLAASEMAFRQRTRLGVRYINRLDLPSNTNPIRYEDYFKVFVEAPEEMGPNAGYAGRIQFPLSRIDGLMIIQTASTASPLPGHAAFMLDIDIGITKNIPNKGDELATFLAAIRDEKNRAFELSITQKARERFQT